MRVELFREACREGSDGIVFAFRLKLR